MKILKIGGSVITDKKGYKKPQHEQMKQMARAVGQVWSARERDLIVVHGAGSFGHALVQRHEINEGIQTDSQRFGYADTHASCAELSQLLVNAFLKENIPAISISPNSIIRQRNKRICEFNEDVIFNYLSDGYLPVLYGDMVPDLQLRGSVCSGDQIMAWLGRKADFLVFATNVDGVLDSKGRLIEEISQENYEEVLKHLRETKNDVTGAMKGKIEELLGLGTVSYIVNAAYPQRLIALLKGDKTICTEINP